MPLPQANAAGLTFSGMSHLGVGLGFSLHFKVNDPACTVWLHVGSESNRVKVTGTTPLSRQADVLLAIDNTEKWAQSISLWMSAEKNGAVVAKTAPVPYFTHVRPFMGELTIADIESDSPALTYPGNGVGRLLSKQINERYYFTHGGHLETQPTMRGFDCTSFPMALLKIPKLEPPRFGKQLCEAISAAPCGLEQISTTDMTKRFKDNTIPVGLYVLFSSKHVLLYDSYQNVLNEFNYGGFKKTYAPLRPLEAPQNLWWMRKLPESCNAAFGY